MDPCPGGQRNERGIGEVRRDAESHTGVCKPALRVEAKGIQDQLLDTPALLYIFFSFHSNAKAGTHLQLRHKWGF